MLQLHKTNQETTITSTLSKVRFVVALTVALLFIAFSAVLAEDLEKYHPYPPSQYYQQQFDKMIVLFKEHKKIKLYCSKHIPYAYSTATLTTNKVTTPFGIHQVPQLVILYNPDDFADIDRKTGTKYASLIILAHELGHHYNNHVVDDTTLEIKENNAGSCSKWGSESEADFFAGLTLGLMGASDKEIVAAYTQLPLSGNKFHPDSPTRISMIITGLHAATKQGSSKVHAEEFISKLRAGKIREILPKE